MKTHTDSLKNKINPTFYNGSNEIYFNFSILNIMFEKPSINRISGIQILKIL